MDEVIKTPVSPGVQAFFLQKYLEEAHPDGVIESISHFEFMFYTSQAARDSWDAEGRTDENASEMFHVICERGRLTLVHEGNVDLEEIRNNLAATYCF